MLEKLQLIHLLSFLGFFILFGILEYFFPLRKKVGNTKKRWTQNISLSIVNTVIARFFFFVTPISVALYMATIGWGFFNIFEGYFIFELIISVVLLDLLIYLQHILAHRWGWFWKIHSIHHSDTTLDVSTAVRFHTLEIILSLFIKIFFIALFGIDAVSVVIFEILLVSSAMFNHSNIRLAHSLDTVLSYVFVTPEFHQVHHSIKQKQTDSNYGFFLSIWDRIFKTYTCHKFKVEKIGLSRSKENISFKDIILLDTNK